MATTQTQFSELQKLLINVAEGKCDAFIKTHVNAAWDGTTSELPEFNIEAGINDAYYNKVVFLQKYNAIYTKGTFFGYNGDLKASFNDLVADLKKGISANGITVKYDAEQNKIVTTVVDAKYDTDTKEWDDIDNVVTGETVKTYVEDYVKTAVDAAAVTAMEYKGGLTQAGFDAFANTEDKKSLDGNVWVAKEEITISATEKAEIGDTIIVHYDEALAGKLGYVVIERNVDNTVTVDGDFNKNQILVAGEDPHTVHTTGYTIGLDNTTTFGTANTVATEAAVVKAISDAIDAIDDPEHTGTGDYITYTYSTTNGITSINSIGLDVAEYSVSGNTLDNTTEGLVDHEALNTVIGYLDGKIDAINCEVTTLTEVDNDYLKVTDDSATGDNDRNYKIELNVVNLGDAVGMTYDEATGKWIAPEGNPSAKNGLASAADVANELVSDEKVIAAALNDHEARLDVLEAFADDINGTIQDQLVIGDVKVDGLKAEVTTAGLVNADLLVSVINALDPWEDYE